MAPAPPTLRNYNPHFPCTIGPEWMPYQDAGMWLDTSLNAYAAALVANTSDSISTVWPMVVSWIGTQSVSLEIYDITSAPPPLPTLTWQTFYPGGNRLISPPPWTPGAWGPFNGWNVLLGGADTWEALTSVALTPYTWTPTGQPVDNNQMVFNYFGLGYDFAVSHAGTAGALNGRWITRVQSHATVAQYYQAGGPPNTGITLTPYIWINGQKYLGAPVTFGASQGTQDITYDWYVNPATGLPWTPGDIDDFDSTASGSINGLGFIMAPTNNWSSLGCILQAQLKVESAATDVRLAMAARTAPVPGGQGSSWGAQGWMPWNLKNTQTAGPTSISLTKGNKYLFLFRKSAPVGYSKFALAATSDPAGIASLAGSLSTLGPPYWTQYTGPLGVGTSDAAGSGKAGIGVRLDTASHMVADLGIESGQVVGIALTKSGSNTPSLDSQPYATTSPLAGDDPWADLREYFNNSPINVGRWMKQQFTPSVNDDYAWINVLCSQVAGSVNGDLLIKVKRQSDDVQFGSTVTITSADMQAPVRAWRKVGMPIDTAASLIGGTQYYLEITSTAAANQGWLVQCINSGYEPNPTGPPSTTNAIAGWGAGIDKLTFGDPAMNAFGWTAPDAPGSVVACVTISTIPLPPEGFAASAVGQTCCIDNILLSWTAMTSVYCGNFLAYEIQREENEGWMTIARITDSAVSTFSDYESKANTATNYRMRVVRDDNIPSLFTATVTATAAMTNCCGIMFTSNEQPNLTVFYQDTVESRTFTFPTFEQKFAPYNRNYQVVFRELENRGTTFNTSLKIRAGRTACGPGCDDPTGIGVDVFDPLRNICRAGLSYVCVKNESGNRWFGYVKTTQGIWTQGDIELFGGWGGYSADIEVTEVTNVPSSPDSAVVI